MLAIGRALMSPKLILLDEPSMGLAPVMVLRLFDLIRRSAEGYTILIVEQNVRQVLKIVDRAYLLEVGRIKMEGRAAELRGRLRPEGVRRPVIDPIFLAEAAINGILLGGILALLALGLNLIFGVIDIVWIVYVDLVMLCMYAIYFTNQVYGWPFWLAALVSLGLGALLGVGVHVLVISPILASPPINQLLATGGLLFFIQSFATFLWTTDHRSVAFLPAELRDRRHLPAATRSSRSASRSWRCSASTLPHPHLHGHRDPRRGPGPGGDGPDGRRSPAGLRRDLGGRRPHGRHRGALLVFQYAVHPFFGGQFGPLTFMICVLGGLGNMVGAFVASFVMSEIISIAG